MTEPTKRPGNLHNDDVQFQFADDLAPGTGYTPQEINEILNTPLDVATAVTAAAANGADPYDDDDEDDEDDVEAYAVDPGFIKLSAEAYGSDRGLREYWTHGEGAAKIRWGTNGDFKRCVRHLSKWVRNPEGLCNEYHTEAVGAPPGKGHAVSTETFAVAPVTRLGSSNPYSVQWEGTLAVEGTETGDGREFSLGSLTWPELPIPLMYQYITSHGGTTDESTNVGNITEVWRDGKFIKGRGTIDISDAYGLQAARKMKGKYLRGVSIDADSVKEGDVELVFAPPAAGLSEDEVLLQMMSATPDKTIFHNGRIRGATLVNLPAFVEASLDLIGDTSALDVIVASAVADKFDLDAFADDLALGVRKYIRDKLGRFDDTGPGSTSNETKKLPHVGDERVPDNMRNLKHPIGESHQVPDSSDDSYPSSLDYDEEERGRDGLPVRYEDDSDFDFRDDDPEEDKRKRRAAREADYGVKVITASAGRGRKFTIEIPELPPLGFFQEPTDLPPIGAMWVESNGHVYGLVGPSDTPHRSFRNKRVTIPMGNVDYTRWMNRPTLVEGPDGEVLKIRTGVITMNCGHLNAYASSDTEERMRHYDNSCSIAALVRVGESRKHKAPWVAGTILPMSAEDFLRFQACQLSGDWSPHRQRRGWKEFVASLAVPVPGFARSTDVAAVRVDDNAVVVASAVPIRLTEDAYDEVDMNDIHTPNELTSASAQSNKLALGRIRAQLGIGNRQALADIRRRVDAGASPRTASAATATPVKEKKVGCAPCAAKARRDGQTSAQEPPVQQVEGFGDGDPVKQAQDSANNAIANTRTASRG